MGRAGAAARRGRCSGERSTQRRRSFASVSGRMRIRNHFLAVTPCSLKLLSVKHQHQLPGCQGPMSQFRKPSLSVTGENKTQEGKCLARGWVGDPQTLGRAHCSAIDHSFPHLPPPSSTRALCCGLFLVEGTASAPELKAGHRPWRTNIPGSFSTRTKGIRADTQLPLLPG